MLILEQRTSSSSSCRSSIKGRSWSWSCWYLVQRTSSSSCRVDLKIKGRSSSSSCWSSTKDHQRSSSMLILSSKDIIIIDRVDLVSTRWWWRCPLYSSTRSCDDVLWTKINTMIDADLDLHDDEDDDVLCTRSTRWWSWCPLDTRVMI